MLRSPSRTKSLADLSNQVEVSFTNNKNKKVNTEAAAQRDPSQDRDTLIPAAADLKSPPTVNHLPEMLKGFRCPVAHGKRNVSTPPPETQCLQRREVHAIGHNGCVIDVNQPESINLYLGAAIQLIHASYQTSPESEIGRMLAVARDCRHRAREESKRCVEFSEADEKPLADLIWRTAEKMAEETMAAVGKSMPPNEHYARESAEIRRLMPFAQKLVLDRSRLAQADQRFQTWTKFAHAISAFCLDYIRARYPDVVDAKTMTLDKDLAERDPKAAYAQAMKQALRQKWRALEKDVLRR